jgi:hypothetical protein
MAIIVGCTAVQGMKPPRTAPEAPKPRMAIRLDAKLLDACVGQYEFPPDNGSWLEWKLTIRRHGDQLMVQITLENKKSWAAVEIYPESETSFLVKANSPHELTFVNNDKGEVTAAIVRFPGGPAHEGKKLKNE